MPSVVTLSVEGIERIKAGGSRNQAPWLASSGRAQDVGPVLLWQGSALHPIAAQLRYQIEEDFRDLCTKKLVRLEGASQLQPPSAYP